MSFDIYTMRPGCDHCGRPAESQTDWNMTSNMAPAWRAAGTDLASFDGRPAEGCISSLAHAISAMEADPARFAQYDAPNGWGSMKTLVPALKELLEQFRAHPEYVVRVSR